MCKLKIAFIICINLQGSIALLCFIHFKQIIAYFATVALRELSRLLVFGCISGISAGVRDWFPTLPLSATSAYFHFTALVKCVRLVYDVFFRIILQHEVMLLHEPVIEDLLNLFCSIRNQLGPELQWLVAYWILKKKNDHGFISPLMKFMSSSLLVLDLL